MSLQIPDKVKGCKKLFEEVYFKENGELIKPRDALLEKMKKEEAEVSEIEEQLAAHVKLLGPVKETYDLFNSFVKHVKEQVDEALEQAEAADDASNFKKGQWYVERMDVLDNLRCEADLMIEIKTELEYHVHDFTSKITRSTAPKKKEPKKKEPKKKGPAKAQPGPTKTKGSPANVTPEPMEPNLKEWIPEGPPYQHESPRMLEPRVQHLQNPVRGWETGPQAGSSSSSYLEDQLRLRDAKILEQSKTIEELKSMIADYKRMHKAEKKLAEKAEDEIERLKEQCKRRNEPDKDQQQLREKMDAYHYELLNALRQGFGSVTIDILRATR